MDEKITGSLLNGNLIAMYVLFHDGTKPYKTLAFTLDNCDLMNVDIDDRGEPMGVEIIYVDSPTDKGCFIFDTNHRAKKEAIVRRLLAAITRLTMIRMMQEALTEEVNMCLNVIVDSGMYSTTDFNIVDGKCKVIQKNPEDES